MKPSSIRTISNLSRAIANPTTGDWLFLDLDETLLLTGLKKYEDAPSLTESELVSTIKMLRERGIKVIGLTARKTKYATATCEQLKSVGIELDEVIHAPNQEHKNHEQTEKGKSLKEFVNAHQQEIHDGKLKRIFIFDNLLKQLQDIEGISQELGVPIFLKHYTLPQYLTMANDSDFAFPENLEDFSQAKELSGGTMSAFSIYNPNTNQKLVLKYGAHEDAGKLEILTNALYHELGILVPPMRIYTTIPKALAQSMKLSSPYGMFKVCKYVDEANDLSSQERLLLVKNAAIKNFVAHTLLGNIDVAKEDNFIVDTQHHVYCIDAGANFIFRSKGAIRKEDPALASEIDSLRDPEINQRGHQWFGEISTAELRTQLIEIQAKLSKVERVAWDVSEQLKIPDELRNKFLQNLSDRMDTLTTRLQQQTQSHAKVDKKARVGATGAGVLTYMIKDDKPYVLLSKRVRHEWWDNFGGKSDAGDESLATTAAREVAEESNQQINYTVRELLNSPFHDIVTGEGKNHFIYRMYLCEYDEIDLRQLNDHEHTAHLWIPLDTLLKTTKEAMPVEIEGKKTVAVQVGAENILLYPPLYCMLKQMTVSENLQHLNDGHPLMHWKTLGYADHDSKMVDCNLYRPLITPQQKHSELALNVLKKAAVLRNLKSKNEAKSAIEQKNPTPVLSQSEIHLKAVLGDEYQEENLEGNVRCFVEKHYRESSYKQDELIRHCIKLIQNEQQGDGDQFYFYHACSNEVAFVYDVYTRLYSELQANAQWPAFRTDNEHFKRFNNIAEFIAFYSENGTHEICNNDKNFNDCALSANVFLFGNHETSTSSSIDYMLNNDARRRINLAALLSNVFKPFHVTDQEIDRLVSLFKQYKSKQGGVLYQIGMSREDARRTSYASGFLGKISFFQNSYDLTEIIDKFKSDTNLIATGQEYISKLQARVMLPPQLCLQTHAVTLNPLTDPIQKRYQASLKHVIDALLYQILSHYCSLNADHAQGALTKTLPSVLRDNQLTYSDPSPEAALISAVKACNGNLVKDLLQKFPELMHQKIHTQLDYISVGYGVKKKKPLTVLQFIIKHSTIPFEGIIDFNQDAWLDAFLHIKKYRQFKGILNRLPESQRAKFVSKYINLVLLKPKHITEIFASLPQCDRLSLATAHIAVIKTDVGVSKIAELLRPEERLQFVRQNLCSENDLIYLLSLVPEKERLPLAKLHCKLITTMSAFMMILEYLPYEIRYDFADGAIGRIARIASDLDMAGILKLLPKQLHIKFIEHHEAEIRNAKVLAKVLALLPESERFKYAMRNQDKIGPYCDSLEEIICLLCVDNRYEFALANAKKLSTDSFPKVLLALKPEHRLTYALANKDWCDPSRHYYFSNPFSETLEALPQNDKIKFVNACPEKLNRASLETMSKLIPHSELCAFMLSHINNFTAFIFTLSLLAEGQRLNIAMKYQHLINRDSSQLAEVIGLLPADNRMSFALQHKHIITTGTELNSIANLIDEKNRLQFMCSCVQNESTLVAALKVIPIEQRLEFANQHQTVIEFGYALLDVLKYLRPEDTFSFAIDTINNNYNSYLDYLPVIHYFPSEQRLKFVKQLRIDLRSCFDILIKEFEGPERFEFISTFLKTEDQMISVLRLLPAGDRLAFAIQHQALIKKTSYLMSIVELLPKESRFNFATMMQHIIKPDDCFSDMLCSFNPDERLAFAIANRHKILSSTSLAFIERKLPEHARMDFIKSCTNTGETLVYILEHLAKKDVLGFAMLHQDLVVDTYILREVLRYINDQSKCLEYVLAYEWRCQDNRYIEHISKFLPDADRMPYLMRNLKDGWGVAALLNLMPNAERVSFALQQQQLINTGEQLAVVIDQLFFGAEKQAFLLHNQDKVDNFDSLIKLSKYIKPEDQLSFFVSHQDLIKNKQRLMEVVNRLININPTISVDAVFGFITEKLERLHDGQQALSNKELIHFIKEMKEPKEPNPARNEYKGNFLSLSFFGMFEYRHRIEEQKHRNFYDQLLERANKLPHDKQEINEIIFPINPLNFNGWC